MKTVSRITLKIVADRSRKDALLAIGSASLAFLLVLPLYSQDVTQISEVLIGGLIGTALVIAGFAAISRCRPLPQIASTQRAQFGVLSLALGTLLGLANLGANFGLAMLDQSFYDQLVQRFADLSPWVSIFAAPVIEEIALRLFFMGVVAWVAARFVDDSRSAFLIALWLSAIVFGLLHIFRPLPGSSTHDMIYAFGIVIKSGAATFLLGWIFWRWGLPYAILCHAAANAIHLLAEPILFDMV